MEFVMDDVHHHYHYRHCRYYRPDYYQGVLADLLLADYVLVHLLLYLNRHLHCHLTMGARAVSEVYDPNYYYYSLDYPGRLEGALFEFLHIHFDLQEAVYGSVVLATLVHYSTATAA